MKKIIRIVACILLILLCFTACNREEVPPSDDSGVNNTGETPSGSDTSNTSDTSNSVGDTSDTEEKQTETEVPLVASDALILAKKGQTEYTLVTDNQLSNQAQRLINDFCERFSAKTEADFMRATDTDAPTQKELLIYTMDGRDEVQTVLDKLTVPEKNGYRIEVDGTKIIVACANESYLEFALELLDRAIRPCDKNVYGIEKDYVGKLDLPTPAVNITSKITGVSASDGNYSLVVSNTDKSYYKKFLTSLKEDGFFEYSQNTIGDACFATYVKDSVYCKEAVYTMYYPNDSVYKMTYGPLGYLPETRAVQSTLTTPSFAQTQRFGGRGGSSAAGLCCVVQCSDGKYIVFDGGSNNAEDKQILYNYLYTNNPREGKPTVAAWVITHAHGDHMGLANAFLNEYATKINLEMVIYNFPDFDNIAIKNEDPKNMKALTDSFKDVVARKFPSAKTWIAHTGEVMQFAGCKMEILYTPEDYLTGIGLNSYGTFPWGNHTNTTYRLDINGTTVMMLGDSESTLNAWMARAYEEDLKSDILQLTHHGSNGGHISLYRLIDPDICIWPVEEARMQKNATAYDYNRYLVLPASEGGRDRAHYTMDYTVVYECTDNGPVLKEGTAVKTEK